MMKCLLVDDSRMSRMMLKKIIASAHPEWDIMEAADGQEAIDLAKGAELDIILLDYNMQSWMAGKPQKY
jgi:CheY-like chemotaxis protein